MNSQTPTTEQMRSIERWENEGGKISLSMMGTQVDHHQESTAADKLDHPESAGHLMERRYVD